MEKHLARLLAAYLKRDKDNTGWEPLENPEAFFVQMQGSLEQHRFTAAEVGAAVEAALKVSWSGGTPSTASMIKLCGIVRSSGDLAAAAATLVELEEMSPREWGDNDV